MTTVTIAGDGAITLPRDLRERLGLKPGDTLTVTERDGSIVLTAGKPFAKKGGKGGMRLEGDDVHDTAELYTRMGL